MFNTGIQIIINKIHTKYSHIYRQIVSNLRLTRIKMTKTLDCRHFENIIILFYATISPEAGKPPL